MLVRTIALFAFGLAAILCVCDAQARGVRHENSLIGVDADADSPSDQAKQPGKPQEPGKGKDAKGKEGKGPGGKGGFGMGGFGKGGFGKGFGGKGFGGKGGFGKGFGGKGDFKKSEPKKDEPKKDDAKKTEPMKSFGKGPAFGGKLDPETIKTKYELYKKLYEESQKEAASASIEARIDRLIGELQALRNEVRGKKK